VIVATGGRPYRPPLELVDDPPVLDAWEVIRGATVPEGRVVVVDWRCDWVGPGVALLLAAAGHPSRFATNGYTPGFRIQQYVRDATIAALARAPGRGAAPDPAVRLRRPRRVPPAQR